MPQRRSYTRRRNHVKRVLLQSSTVQLNRLYTKLPTATTRVSNSSRKQASRSANSAKKATPKKSGVKRGYYTSTKTGRKERHDSSYELRRFQALDASPLVKDWTRSKAKIRYNLGAAHVYEPDILVTYHDGRVFLEETKGHIWDMRKHEKKVKMAEFWCKKRNWSYRLLFEKDLDIVE